MKFQRRGPLGSEQPVVETDEGVFDLRPVAPDIDAAFFAGDGVQATRDALREGRLPRVDDLPERVGAPLARPGKIVCIGLNYRDHAAETGDAIPDEPIIFMKDPSTWSARTTTSCCRRRASRPTGRWSWAWSSAAPPATCRARAAARDVIAGYVVSHDVSEREYQLERGGQWDKGKSCETLQPARARPGAGRRGRPAPRWACGSG